MKRRNWSGVVPLATVFRISASCSSEKEINDCVMLFTSTVRTDERQSHAPLIHNALLPLRHDTALLQRLQHGKNAIQDIVLRFQQFALARQLQRDFSLHDRLQVGASVF